MLLLKKINLTFVIFVLSSFAVLPVIAETKKAPVKAQTEAVKPWMNKSLSADERADLVIKELTLEEKLILVFGHFGSDMPWKSMTKIPAALPYSAGYVAGIPRLGIPELFETDAGMGVATAVGPTPRERTALPSGVATAATWNLDLAYQGGAMIGSEARSSGFNVLLGGGVNLQREPRNGRNFEYAGEDPLLAGSIVAQTIQGIESNHIVSTVKHYALNGQETGRNFLSSNIDDAGARMSDLLAFQLVIERADPGSVMCGYNRVNHFYACESDYLLNQVLKNDWQYKGWVMSDWGATHSTIPAANNGLDQESGWGFDVVPYFSGALFEAVLNGWVKQERVDNMVHRILRTLFAKGVIDNPVAIGEIDFKAHASVTQADAEEALVLLKNSNNILPLTKDIKKIAVIGSHSDGGVLSGGGSSQVYPVGGMAVKDVGPKVFPGPTVYYPSSPLRAIKARAPQAQVEYNEGTDIKAAAKLAAASDVVVLFANQWLAESIDAVSLSLPDNQDALIAAVAKANPKTIVVLETGGPVTMPWLDKVSSVLQAWYPGTSGGEAIGRVLFGEVNPSGHLPVTFPASENQLPRVKVDGDIKQPNLRFDVNYQEGAAVGYKWFDLKKLTPLFPFGFGLSYSTFSYSEFGIKNENGKMYAHVKVTNTGSVKGKDVPQIYASPVAGGWEAPKRLVGWGKVDLNPGESKEITTVIEPRVLSMFNGATKTWCIVDGDYKFSVAENAADKKAQSITLHLPESELTMDGKPAN